jgi:surfeit locus 1 family protein
VVQLTGKFDTTKQMLVEREYKGAPGYLVVCPFILSDKNAVLVSRGWIPTDLKEAIEAKPEPEEDVTITGALRQAETPSSFIRQNNSLLNQWYYIDPSQMSYFCNVQNLFEFAMMYV